MTVTELIAKLKHYPGGNEVMICLKEGPNDELQLRPVERVEYWTGDPIIALYPGERQAGQ